MKNTLVAICVAACLSAPAKAGEVKQGDGEPEASLEVDLSALPSGKVTVALKARLVKHQLEMLGNGGIRIVGKADRTIRVSVKRYGDDGENYEATILMLASGAVEHERTFACELCSDTELVTKVGKEVTRLSGRILSVAPQTPAATGNGEPKADEPKADEPPSAEGSSAIGALGGVGIGVAVLGVAGVAAGVPLSRKSDAVRGAEGDADVRRLRPSGLALVGVGGGLMVVGAALIVLDVVRRKKTRTAFLPTVTPNGVAFTLRGRF